MNHEKIEERRAYRRVEVHDLKVINTYMGENVGELVNLSFSGMLINGPEPFEPHRSYKFHIPLDRKTLGQDFIELEAECVWCRVNTGASIFRGGFLFRPESGDQIIVIDQIQSKFAKALN